MCSQTTEYLKIVICYRIAASDKLEDGVAEIGKTENEAKAEGVVHAEPSAGIGMPVQAAEVFVGHGKGADGAGIETDTDPSEDLVPKQTVQEQTAEMRQIDDDREARQRSAEHPDRSSMSTSAPPVPPSTQLLQRPLPGRHYHNSAIGDQRTTEQPIQRVQLLNTKLYLLSYFDRFKCAYFELQHLFITTKLIKPESL